MFEVSDSAQQDILDGYLWYDKIDVELGNDFMNVIELTFQKIKEHPEFYHFHFRKRVRGCKVKGFPFSILYIYENLQIKVIAVFHSSLDPKKLKSRF